jgi:hypothetical protein
MTPHRTLSLARVALVTGVLSVACHRGGASPSAPPASTSAICAHGGRFSLAARGGLCPPIARLSALESDFVSFSGIDSRAYAGALPPCENLPPYDGGFRFRFRVDEVRTAESVAGDGTRIFETTLSGTNLDRTPPCGQAVALRSQSETPALIAGQVLAVAQRTVPRTDNDSPGLYALYDDAGRLLYTTVFGARLDRLREDFGDLLPGLTVTASTAVVCQAVDIDAHLVTARLSTGPATCDVDSHTDRCCDLWGATYEVQMLDG